ncbi:MAG: RNA methyltransferase [Lachnospiraceae bacterium]|nr:RNA methyltransferase [Lachnospiraceae bacterium]
MPVLTSTTNRHIRAVSALIKKRAEREKENAFVIEGLRMLREAPAERMCELYVTEAFYAALSPEDRRRIDALACERFTVTEEVMRRLSDTVHPQGVLGVVSMKKCDPAGLFDAGKAVPLLLVLENLQDPGNLGTILRAGEGAGVTGVLLAGDTADPYNPKVVRGTMGAIFRVPFLRFADIGEAAVLLKKRGIRTYAADLSGTKNYDACDYRDAVAFFIGNEGAGLSEEARRVADERILIPMAGAVESLNAGIAAAVLTFEAARQRRG